MYDGFKGVRIERRGATLWVILDNPPVNAMTPEAHSDLARLFPVIARDAETRAVVITGEGAKAFSAGGDIEGLKRGAEDHARWAQSMTEAREIVLGMLDCDKPIIARINGSVVGMGATIALCCDITIMVETAKIADTHVKIGLVAGDGGALVWPQLVGLVKARRYLLTGDALTGREAEEIGLITQAVPAADLDATVEAWATRLANGASVALYGTKRALNMAIRQQAQVYMDAQLGLESASRLSRDHAIAIDAFLDKQEPTFEGR
jgi:enoyl-CoA hydratase